MRKKSGEEGVAQLYGFLVGGFVFVAAVAGVVVWGSLAGSDPMPGEQAAQEVDAEGLASLLVGSPGAGWADPDAVSLLGLGGVNGSLDAAHVALLQNGGIAAADNGFVDYDEAVAALGLDPNSGFRLNIVPLDPEALLREHDFSHVKALYIGDWTSVASITLPVGQGTIANANTQLNLTMAANTALERSVLDSLGVEFDNQVHFTLGTPTILVQITTFPDVKLPLLSVLGLTLWDGDVVYDNKQYLDSVLPSKLSTGGYDLVVIGSGIDHSTLTSNAVKNSIDTFVRAGGTLMVMGSPGGNFNWMQPILSVSAASVSGAVTAVDAGHAILDTPWDLNWASYPTQGLAWNLGTPANFENVLMQGGQPVLTLSKPGTIGSGTVFLSSIQPRLVAQQLGSAEAEDYMFNMLLYKDEAQVGNYSLAFGEEPPSGIPVSSAVRTTTIDDGGLLVPVRIELLVWATP